VHQVRRPARYPRIYEKSPDGPAISFEDFLKTAAALRGVLAMARLSATDASDADMQAAYKQVGRMMSEELGRQWSVLTAMQYLTGQKADKPIGQWAEMFDSVGLTRSSIEALVAVANDFCANAVPGKTMSSGLLVGAYRQRPLEHRVFLELLELPGDVIDRLKAKAAEGGR
jgi:hypothetical protein